MDIARRTLCSYSGSGFRDLNNEEPSKALDEPGSLAVAVRSQRRPLIPHQTLDRLVVLRSYPRLQWDGCTLHVEKGVRGEEGPGWKTGVTNHPDDRKGERHIAATFWREDLWAKTD